MKRNRIIIDYDEDHFTEAQAMAAVSAVISGGRVSDCATGKHYCWLSVFEDGTAVQVRQRRRGQASDSFRVFMETTK